jgi:short-subunit dehydrogenase
MTSSVPHESLLPRDGGVLRPWSGLRRAPGARRPDLILVARRRDRLEELSDRLTKQHSIGVEVIAADLTDEAGLRSVEDVIASSPPLTLLVNNAGFGAYMPFVELDVDRAEELIRLQVLALTRLTRAALPFMIAAGVGAVVNVSSRLAFSAAVPSPYLPKRATYAATKAYVNTFTQLLAKELEGTSVRVQATCPGVVRTEFHDVVGMDPGSFPADIVMSPEDVVTASLTGLGLGEVICVPGLEDPALLSQIDDVQRQFFEKTKTGTLAPRYKA